MNSLWSQQYFFCFTLTHRHLLTEYVFAWTITRTLLDFPSQMMLPISHFRFLSICSYLKPEICSSLGSANSLWLLWCFCLNLIIFSLPHRHGLTEYVFAWTIIKNCLTFTATCNQIYISDYYQFGHTWNQRMYNFIGMGWKQSIHIWKELSTSAFVQQNSPWKCL